MRKLNLSKLNLEVLTDLEMFQARGTGTSKSSESSTPSVPTPSLCSCGCKYANKGGSSTSANGNANTKKVISDIDKKASDIIKKNAPTTSVPLPRDFDGGSIW